MRGDYLVGAPSHLIFPDGSDPGDTAGRSMTDGPSSAPGATATGQFPSCPLVRDRALSCAQSHAFAHLAACMLRTGLVLLQRVWVRCATGAWGLFWHVTLSPRAAWGLFWHVSLSPHGHVCGVGTACSVFASSQVCADSLSSQLCVAHSAGHSNASLAGYVDAQSVGCEICGVVDRHVSG